MAALSQGEIKASVDEQEGSVMHFHQRLRHLHYDTVIRLASDPVPASGIRIKCEPTVLPVLKESRPRIGSRAGIPE